MSAENEIAKDVEAAVAALENAVKLGPPEIAGLRDTLHKVGHYLRNRQQANILANTKEPPADRPVRKPAARRRAN